RLASSGRYLVGLGPFRDPVSSPLSVVFAPCELGPLSLLSGPSGILSVVRCRSSSCLASSGRSRWSWASSGRSRWSRALPGFRSRLSVVSGFPGPPPLSTAARGAAPAPRAGGGAPTTPKRLRRGSRGRSPDQRRTGGQGDRLCLARADGDSTPREVGEELRSEPEMKTGRWGTPGNYASDSASAAANAPSAKPRAYSHV